MGMSENNTCGMDSLRTAEAFKVQMLKKSAELCDIMLNSTDEDFYGKMCGCAADLLIAVYVLANAAGVPYRVIENTLRRKLRLNLLENNDDDILNASVASLARYALE